MGPCAAYLPGTNGIMYGEKTSGLYSDETISMST